MNVNVIGFGSAVRMDLEEVLVRAELMYQMMHRIYGAISILDVDSSCK